MGERNKYSIGNRFVSNHSTINGLFTIRRLFFRQRIYVNFKTELSERHQWDVVLKT